VHSRCSPTSPCLIATSVGTDGSEEASCGSSSTGATGSSQPPPAQLLRRGDQVVALTRDARRMPQVELLGDDRLQCRGRSVPLGALAGALAGCDAVVALAGEPIAGARWDRAFKERAERSRVGGLSRIVEAIGRMPEGQRPRVLVSASAIGYYGSRGDEELTEDDRPARTSSPGCACTGRPRPTGRRRSACACAPHAWACARRGRPARSPRWCRPSAPSSRSHRLRPPGAVLDPPLRRGRILLLS